MKSSPTLWGVDELSAYLNIPKRTVYSEWKKWGIPGFAVGKHLRFRTQDIESWLEANRADH